MTYAFVNDALVERSQAVVSIDDRGFKFGDGLFETIPVYGRVPYLWEYHISRLDNGLRAVRINANTQDFLSRAVRLFEANQMEDGLLRIQISRGIGGKGYLPTAGIATVVMETRERPAPVPGAINLWLSSYARVSPKALPVEYKLTQGLNSTLARMEAEEKGCGEALLCMHEGHISEASSANIFWRKDKTLYTPSLAAGALAGVTRRRVLELSPWPVREGLYSLSNLAEAEAVVLTNSALPAVAVSELIPKKIHWESVGFAAEINTMIEKDITRYRQHALELLATK